MITPNWMKRGAAVTAMTAFAWMASPAAWAHHATPASAGSAVAGLRDGTALSLSGRLSTLEFVYPGGVGRERIYALVGPDGSATRVQFAAGVDHPAGRFAHRLGPRVARRAHRRATAGGRAGGRPGGVVYDRGTAQPPPLGRFRPRREPVHLDRGPGRRSGLRARHSDRADGHAHGNARARDRNSQRRDDRARYDRGAFARPRARGRAGGRCADGDGARHPAQFPADSPRGRAVHALYPGGGRRRCFFRCRQPRGLLQRGLVRQAARLRHGHPLAHGQFPAALDLRLLRDRDGSAATRTGRGLQPRELPEIPLPLHQRAVVRMGRDSAKCRAHKPGATSTTRSA